MDFDTFGNRAQFPLTVGGYVGWAYTLWPKGAVLFGSPKDVSWMAVAAIGFLCLGALSAASQLGLLRSRRTEKEPVAPNVAPSGAIESALVRAIPNVVIQQANIVNIFQRGPDEYEAIVRLYTATLHATLSTTASISAQLTIVKPPVPTRLKLQFSGGDILPLAIQQDNIWRWHALATVMKGYDPKTQIITEAGRIWNIFLIFDEPTNFKQIRIDGSGAALPMHEVKDSSMRGAVIVFTEELSGVVIDIQLIV